MNGHARRVKKMTSI